eukprot:862621-Pleurochrysis_carterae.AAC.1
MGGGSACAAAVHDGYVLHKPLKRSPFCGEWMDKLMRASLTVREPPTALHPLYTLNRSAAGPAEETLTVNEYPGTHPSYHQYMQMQACAHVELLPFEAWSRARDHLATTPSRVRT